MQTMESALREVGDPRHVAALLTQIEVDAEDPAFNNPTKFVGPFFSEAESARIGQELGWLMREDSGRGFRHVVPSPSALVVLPARPPIRPPRRSGAAREWVSTHASWHNSNKRNHAGSTPSGLNRPGFPGGCFV